MGKESRSRAELKAVETRTSEPVALPTKLEPSEIAYTQAMWNRIQRELAEHEGMKKAWLEFLSAKYSLGAQDRVDIAGTITRVPEKEPA
jgi:hypothetical protein